MFKDINRVTHEQTVVFPLHFLKIFKEIGQ